MKDLLKAVCEYNIDDMEQASCFPQKGTMSSNGKQYTDDEITEMKNTKVFCTNYAKCLAKPSVEDIG